MHPAPSVILFTTLSGAGFGLLMFLGLGIPAVQGLTAFVFFTIAYLFAVGGLIASTFHLGRPDRAWRALSQWRSSWLSREGWLAVLSLIIMACYGVGLVFFDTRYPLVGILGAAFSLATVFCTAMIYAQLKTVPRWHMPLTPLIFVSLSITGGALLSGQVTFTIFMLCLSAVVQLAYWKVGDTAFARAGTTLATATGLGHMGTVTAFEPPHTGSNYLLDEMVYVIGRKHADKLRIIALLLMCGIPLLALLLPFHHLWALIAVISHIAGVAASRWLFFAQAEHVVGLYYGQRGQD